MAEAGALPPVGKKRHPFSWFTDANYFSLPPGFLTYFIKSQLKPLREPTADFTGKVVIVTGANVGLGLEAARHFARLGAAKVILGCRDTAKGEVAKADIEVSTGRRRQAGTPSVSTPAAGANDSGDVVEVWQVDLGSFESVRAFCDRADRELGRLDVMVENAGVAIGSYVECDGGFESTIAVNVVGTFMMALLLLPVMRRTAARFNVEPKLTIVASDAHCFAKFAEKSCSTIFDAFKGKENMNEDRYNLSKLLDILLARELASRLGPQSPVIVNTLNPGFCRSELFRHAPFPLSIFVRIGLWLLGRTPEMGSRTLVAAAAAGRESHGRYMDCCAVRDESPFARSAEGRRLQVRLWDELLGVLEGIVPGIGGNITSSS